MSTKKALVFFGILVAAAVVLTACASGAGPQGEPGPQGPAGETGPQGPAGPAAEVTDLSCTECHNDTTLITSKEFQWEESVHANGTAAAYAGDRAGCAGCHSGGTFSAAIAAGEAPGLFEGLAGSATHQDCRTCHQIHTTYTGEDWALETTDAVDLFAIEGATFDGGEGNLCVQCHQPRRDAPVAEDGMITGISGHWGPHHGPQSGMLLGLAGAGVEGSPGRHYQVENTCVGCHLGADANHTFEPSIDKCLECHDGVESFDINGVQTQVQELGDELEALLVAAGLVDPTDGHPLVTEAPEGQGQALWNWIYIMHEDKSMGVHNPSYTIALLEYSIDLMK